MDPDEVKNILDDPESKAIVHYFQGHVSQEFQIVIPLPAPVISQMPRLRYIHSKTTGNTIRLAITMAVKRPEEAAEFSIIFE